MMPGQPAAVAAMIEGLLRHGTDAGIEANDTDTHGASLVGFALTELLGFKLLPRLKNIGAIQLYAPGASQAGWPRLEKILKKRPIDWELIARNYDQMVEYATALRLRTAETDQVLRRFPRAAVPSNPSTSPWRNSAGPCGPFSPATTSPIRSCAARSTPACRSSRTGTPPTTRSTTAARA
jgi:TnpA family transposase